MLIVYHTVTQAAIQVVEVGASVVRVVPELAEMIVPIAV